MVKKLLASSAFAGLMIYAIYRIVNRFIIVLPDIAAYPMMIVSIILMTIGLIYNGYCLGKKRNPYNFK